MDSVTERNESEMVLKEDENDQKPKRKKLGRAARRRKNKVRAIEHALQSLLCGIHNDVSVGDGDESKNDNGESESSQSSQLPSDRNRPLPGAIQRRQEMEQQNNMNGSKVEDEAMLVSQLGYMPGNAIGVVGRTEHLKHLYPELYKVLQSIDAKQSYARNNNRGEASNKNAHTNANENGTKRTLNMPTALKLYPLVSRDVHNGGKSGRKFKSRKRGHEEIIQTSSAATTTATTTTQEVDTYTEKKKDEAVDGVAANSNANADTVLEPFPTMYWLTHPFLRTMISQIELGTTNNVTQMEQRLSSSTAYLEAMKNVHESYGTHRWNLLTEDDVQEVQARKWTDAIGSVRGVAGIRNHNTIKCLHTHAAHYLAFLGNQRSKVIEGKGTSTAVGATAMEENLVGKWVLEAVNEAVKNMNIQLA